LEGICRIDAAPPNGGKVISVLGAIKISLLRSEGRGTCVRHDAGTRRYRVTVLTGDPLRSKFLYSLYRRWF